MIKSKFITSVVMSTILMSTTASLFAADIDLGALDTDTATTTSGTTTTGATVSNTGTTTASTGSTATSEKKVSKVTIIPWTPSVDANDKKAVEVIVQVQDSSNQSLTDSDIEVKAEIVNGDATSGVFSTGAFQPDTKYFNFSYKAGSKVGTVTLKVTATSKSNPTDTVSQTQTIEVIETAKLTTTSVKDNVMVEPTTSTGVTSTGSTESGTTAGVHITKTEVLDLNRIKVTFDTEIALSDKPLEMLTIESVKNKTKINLSNVTLGQDKKSLVILTKDALAKEEYHVIVNTVVDGKSMKSVSVVNGTTTVSGFGELLLIALASLAALAGTLFAKRKRFI